MPEYSKSEQLLYVASLTSIAVALYLASLYNYLLIHSLIEIITIAIGFALFILTWNARKFMGNDFLKIIGIGYAFIAFIDLLHTLAYKGMNVFPGFGANLPTQLWIAARYLQAVTLCIAPLYVECTVGKDRIFASYTAAVALLVLAVYTGNFPDCFVDGKGLTVFKIGSEYVISALLLLALYLFYRERNHFTGTVFMLTASSIVCTVLSELSFTAYASVYGFANLAGHFCKLAAFYLIYRALLVTGFKEPFDLIFRELTQAKELLEKYRDTLEEKVRERTVALEKSLAERTLAEETLHLQAVELEAEVAERQMAQESLQDQALQLENEIEERRNAQNELGQLNESLEQRVQERTAELEARNVELEHMNRLFVGRELRMVELKEKIREMEQLKNQLSQTVAQGEGDS